MIAKKVKILFITLICFIALTITSICVGCSNGGNSWGGEQSKLITSYISTDSRVYNSTTEVVTAVADTVVEIQTESVKTQWGMQYIVSGAGSGVIVSQSDSDYYIITNNHVIDGANEITVTLRNGENYEATLLATDDSADVAVVTISSGKELSIAVWGNSDELNVGEDLIAIGNPMGSLGGTVTKGILSASSRTITVGNFAMTLLQTDTAINPGNSGGGLFNMRGELIGIVNAKTTDEEIEGICFAIPGNSARNVYNDLLTYGYINGRATMNIDLAEGTISSGINTQSQTIIYITSVNKTAEGTFKQYDRIYKINGVQISSILDYNIALSKINVGDQVNIEVFRGEITHGYFGSSISFSSDVTSFTVVATQYNA